MPFEVKDPEALGGLYDRVLAAFPDAYLEDRHDLPEIAQRLGDHLERVSYDSPIRSAEDIGRTPLAARVVNVKPSRIGGLRLLFDVYARCARERRPMYGGGMGELGVGRGQIELLAALFHPDAPNDVAPSAYNEDDPTGGLPASPLTPRPEATGFRWAAWTRTTRAGRGGSRPRARTSTAHLGTHCDDFEQGFKPGEVGWVPRIDGEFGGDCRGRNQEVDRSTTSRFASSADDRGVEKSVGTSYRCVKRDWLEGRLGSLKAILATCALGWVGGRVGASGQLRECDRRHCDLRRQSVLGDLFDFDDDRGVDKTAGMPPVRHAG